MQTGLDISPYKLLISAIISAIAQGDEGLFNSLVSEPDASFQDVQRVIEEYGNIHIIPLPDEGFDRAYAFARPETPLEDLADQVTIPYAQAAAYCLSYAPPGTIRLEMPLWTKEEGESDLWIYFHCSHIDGVAKVSVAGIYVP